MAHEGANEGFYVLDEIVCEAVSGSGLAPSACRPGFNEGMSVEKEIVWQMPKDTQAEDQTSTRALLESLKTEVERLGQIVTESPDPARALELVSSLMLAKFPMLGKSRLLDSKNPNG